MHGLGLLGLIAGYSDSVVITEVVLGVFFGVLGYVASKRYERRRGVTPWRWPSGLWAVLLFFLLLIGVVLYLIACSTTRPGVRPPERAPDAPYWPSDPRSAIGPPGEGWNAPAPGGWGPAAPQGWDEPAPGGWGALPGGNAPAPPGGWDAPPPPGTVFPGLGTPPWPGSRPPELPASPAPPPPPPPPPRSWLPDPSGRHELRYWDGTRFTEHVADDGKISVDPL